MQTCMHAHTSNCNCSHIILCRVYLLTYKYNRHSVLETAVSEEDSGGSAELACRAALWKYSFANAACHPRQICTTTAAKKNQNTKL